MISCNRTWTIIKWPCCVTRSVVLEWYSLQKVYKKRGTSWACKTCTCKTSKQESRQMKQRCLKFLKKYCKPCSSTWIHHSEMWCNQWQWDAGRMVGLRRAFSTNDKKKEGGKSDERTVIKVRGQRESIIWSVCSEKAPRSLSWISKHPALPEVTSLSLRINNQPLPVWEQNRWLCTLD